MSDKGVWRTALAHMGLLKRLNHLGVAKIQRFKTQLRGKSICQTALGKLGLLITIIRQGSMSGLISPQMWVKLISSKQRFPRLFFGGQHQNMDILCISVYVRQMGNQGRMLNQSLIHFTSTMATLSQASNALIYLSSESWSHWYN